MRIKKILEHNVGVLNFFILVFNYVDYQGTNVVFLWYVIQAVLWFTNSF